MADVTNNDNPNNFSPEESTSAQSAAEQGSVETKKHDKATMLRLYSRRVLIVLVHMGLFALSFLLAFGLAYNFRVFTYETDWFADLFLPMLPIILAIKLIIFWRSGLYYGWWRYVSLQDLLRIMNAALVSTIVFIGIFWLGTYSSQEIYKPLAALPMSDFRQSVFLLDWACTIALVTGVRVAVRLYHEEFSQIPGGRLIRLLIVGAGNAGESALREIHRMHVEQYDVIGLIDDDPTKHGASIFGCKVLGGTDRLRALCDKHQVDQVLLAMPSVSPKDVRRVVESCQGTNVRFLTLPAMADLIAGRVKVSQIRDVDINDLLGREAVKLDTGAISEYVQNKVVLITGAGGSIGSEMCRQVARFKPGRLVLVEQAENALFHIERELRSNFSEIDITAYVCDIYDRKRVNQIFAAERPAVVYHAAAHKHVPLMELNPAEAIKNNVFGTKNCADAAATCGCQKFVMISTDKAVNPTSIMGCSKRVAEMYIQSISEPGRTQFVTVRFGNVLGSNGSVVPIFKEQIARGGPVTVTHADMRRYFMTIPESSQLVMQAAAIGKGGEIFLLDMGEPVKIVDLARDLITLSGFTPGEDIEIVFSGIRPGEKLFEELSVKGEDLTPTSHEKIAVWKRVAVKRETIESHLEELAKLADCDDGQKIRQALKRIVPEYQINGNGNGNSLAAEAQAGARRGTS
jgi:FlaA1/EpsC-like NDP-sugar epimerase